MNVLFKDYKKYRWFFTKSGKLVIGGKSAAQNDELLSHVRKTKKELVIMHTTEPGSPFSVIISDSSNVTKSDKEECAIFTACFSKAWKEGKKNASVDTFHSSQLFKLKNMKTGTWGVKSKIERVSVLLALSLTTQEGVLRAVPQMTVSKKETIISLCPGKIDKRDLLPKLELELNQNLDQNELLSALPAGGSRIFR